MHGAVRTWALYIYIHLMPHQEQGAGTLRGKARHESTGGTGGEGACTQRTNFTFAVCRLSQSVRLAWTLLMDVNCPLINLSLQVGRALLLSQIVGIPSRLAVILWDVLVRNFNVRIQSGG